MIEGEHASYFGVLWSNMQDKANPLAAVLSAAMLLKFGLGEENTAKIIENAVLDALNKGFRTGDIYSAGNVRAFISISLLLFFFYKSNEKRTHTHTYILNIEVPN